MPVDIGLVRRIGLAAAALGSGSRQFAALLDAAHRQRASLKRGWSTSPRDVDQFAPVVKTKLKMIENGLSLTIV